MTEEGSRFPLPALAIAILVLAVVHGPLVFTPALGQEPALLDGSLSLTGWLPGVACWRVEQSLLGEGLVAHRIAGVLLEAAILMAMSGVLLTSTRARSGAVLLTLAYLLHPLHAETALRLESRTVLISELLLALGTALVSRSTPLARLPGALALAAGAATMPAAVVLALPLTLAPDTRRRAWLALPALLVGALTRLVTPTPAPSLDHALAGPRLLLRPDLVGITAPIPAEPVLWVFGLVACLAVLILIAVPGRRSFVVRVAAVALLVGAVAPWVRPGRPDVVGLGAVATPDLFLPLLAAFLWAALRSGGAGWRRLPVWGLLIFSLVHGYLHGGVFQNEGRWLDRAVELDPDCAALRTLRGRSLLQRAAALPEDESYDLEVAALRDADRSWRQQQENPEARQLRCQALAALGKFDEAREACDLLIERHPDRASPLFLRGELELRSGDTIEALRWFRAAGNHPASSGRMAPFLSLLDQVYAEIDAATLELEPAEVRKVCRRLVAALPGEIRAREALANTYAMEGDFEQAIAEFENVLRYDDTSEVALKALITLHEGLNRPEAAVPYRKRLLEVAGRESFE